MLETIQRIKSVGRVNIGLFAHIFHMHHCKITVIFENKHRQQSVPFNSILNKWIQVLLQCHLKSCTALVLHGRLDWTMKSEVVGTFAHQSLLPMSLIVFILRREMRIEVAVHLVLRNHSMAESAFIRAAARRRLQLCPHINCITQPRAPDRLQSKINQKKAMYYLYSKTIFTLTRLRSSTTRHLSCSSCCFKHFCISVVHRLNK